MQFSFDRKAARGSGRAQSASAGAASEDEKLKKAIERNRAKMAKRQAGASAPQRQPRQQVQPKKSLADKLRSSGMPGRSAPESVAPPRPSRRAQSSQGLSAADQEAQQSLINKMRARRSGGAKEVPPRVPTPGAAAPTAPRRRQVTDPDKIELNEPIRKRTTAPANVSYSETSPVKAPARTAMKAKRTVKTKSQKAAGLTAWAVKGTWAFCAFLLVRLIFSEGGVVEYYDKKSALDQKSYELQILKTENIALMEELELTRSNSRYQKKLVRDHLGYIARDEYLILFPENSKRSSRRGFSAI